MEPLDLCVRPLKCIVCKRRFWTGVELKHHTKFGHETISSFISHTLIAGNNDISKSPKVPFNQEPNHSSQNSIDSLLLESIRLPDNTSNSTSIFNPLNFGESESRYSPSGTFNQGPNQFLRNSSVSLPPGNLSDNTTSNPANIFHTRIVETDQIPNFQSVAFCQEPNQLSQNSNDSLCAESVQMPNNAIVDPMGFLHTLIVKSDNQYSPSVPFNQGSNQLRQNSIVSLHPGQVQEPPNTASFLTNISQKRINETSQISMSPSVFFNRESDQLSQNSSDFWDPASVLIPDSVNMSQLIQNSNVSLHPGLVQVPENTTSVPKSVSHKRIVENKQILKSTNISFNQEPDQLSHILSDFSHPESVHMPDNTSSLSTSILHALKVGDGNPYSPIIPFNQGQNQLSQNSSVSFYPELFQESANTTSIFENISHKQIVENNEIPRFPSVLFNKEPDQLSKNSRDYLNPSSTQMPDNTTAMSASMLYSIIVGETQNSYQLSVPFNQGPNQMSKNSSVSLHPVVVQGPSNTTSIPANISYFQISGNNQIPHSTSVPLNQGPNQQSENSSVSRILTRSGLVQVQDKNTSIQANNSRSCIVGTNQNPYSPGVPFNQGPNQLLENIRVSLSQDSNRLLENADISMQPVLVQVPDTTTSLQKQRISKKSKANRNKKIV